MYNLPSFLPLTILPLSVCVCHTDSQRFFLVKLAKMNKQPIELMKNPWPLQKCSFRSHTQTMEQLIDSQCVNKETASASAKPCRTSVCVYSLSHEQDNKACGDLHWLNWPCNNNHPTERQDAVVQKGYPRKDVYLESDQGGPLVTHSDDDERV